ncbi:alpha-amylase family glycosyl hydrolase [Adhaeribacter soli]|uniref:Alpha-amylase n=1 Tax=Adhaeribacter soli TaxID=2607655 RepID=A0A5N1J6F2_9BACT|nr:alpha-amylase family glycosyl hydrolase [Adhaeribacter soli]KAA9345532.1 alpha-amylase [Adhaeribacter soli]
METTPSKYHWWQECIIYQIYPRSFQDSDGDGIGDIQGIISRLDYLKELGILSIWVSPIFQSPMADFGYDISDYTGIHPIFGTMEDFDQLLAEVHRRGMRLLLDFVPNHTSDQHPWFKESRSSRDNPKRDWYIWHDANEDGSEPNNWLAMFGETAWEWDEKTQQYYYHGFLKEQPDLNWRNPEVQEAMFDVMRFWFDKGVDGFRIDVIYHLIKDAQFRNNPSNPDYQPHMNHYDKLLPVYSTDQPEVHEIARKMRKLTDSYPGDRVLIGEVYLPINKLVAYYGADNNEVHMPFNFQLLVLPWDAEHIASTINQYEGALPEEAWPNWVLSNHDQPRITSRVGATQARVAAMMLLTLRGTPTIYYGDEIGMRDIPIPFDEVQDPQGLNMPGLNLSRDPARTPMQWDITENAGFTSGKPWLRIALDFRRLNVEVQEKDPFSMLTFYKELIMLRQNEPALRIGSYTPVYADKQIISYVREAGDTRFLILLNLSHRPSYFKPPHFKFSGTIEVATITEWEGNIVTDWVNLAGDEGIIVRLS